MATNKLPKHPLFAGAQAPLGQSPGNPNFPATAVPHLPPCHGGSLSPLQDLQTFQCELFEKN